VHIVVHGEKRSKLGRFGMKSEARRVRVEGEPRPYEGQRDRAISRRRGSCLCSSVAADWKLLLLPSTPRTGCAGTTGNRG
jgi:hypothetical protein